MTETSHDADLSLLNINQQGWIALCGDLGQQNWLHLNQTKHPVCRLLCDTHRSHHPESR